MRTHIHTLYSAVDVYIYILVEGVLRLLGGVYIGHLSAHEPPLRLVDGRVDHSVPAHIQDIYIYDEYSIYTLYSELLYYTWHIHTVYTHDIYTRHTLHIYVYHIYTIYTQHIQEKKSSLSPVIHHILYSIYTHALIPDSFSTHELSTRCTR